MYSRNRQIYYSTGHGQSSENRTVHGLFFLTKDKDIIINTLITGRDEELKEKANILQEVENYYKSLCAPGRIEQKQLRENLLRMRRT